MPGPKTQMNRVSVIEHNDQRVLMVDLTEASAEEIEAQIFAIQRYVTSQPPNSVLVLSDWTRAHIDKDILTRLKKLAAYDRPHVKRSAIVAQEKSRELVRALGTFSARQNIAMFHSRQEAIEWLTSDEDNTREHP